ncbi:MAG: hypothetical protein KJ645_12680 [Planctomycetes bacterium]|nr:hypothetical protein [Planctomycetota bacterium]
MADPDLNRPDSTGEGPTPQEGHTKEELKHALKVFKKRLKLMRLDDESRIGGGSMSGGNKSGIVAIRPPNQIPKSIWDELVRQGKLKEAGHGLYELTTV